MKRVFFSLAMLALVLSMFAPASATKIARWWQSDFAPEQLLSGNNTQNAPLLSGTYLSWLDSRGSFHDPEGRIMPRLFMKSLATGEEKPCSAFTRKTMSRSMHKNISVWAESSTSQGNDENFDIISYDFSTGLRKPICTDRKRQDSPQVNREWVIWRDWRNCETSTSDKGEFEVFGMNLQEGKEFSIKPKDQHGTAELSGDYAVLSTRTSTKQDFDIHLFILASKRTIPICTATGDQFLPKLVGNMVVWLDCRSCPNFSDSKVTAIYGYSLSTKKEIAISTQVNREYGLASGDRYMAWFYQPKPGIAGSIKPHIRGYDTITGQFFNITNQPGMYRNLSVSGKYCIYELADPLSDFGSDIFVYDFTKNRTWTVFKGYGNQLNPRIYGDYAVWEDHGSNDSESVTVWGTNLSNPSSKPAPQMYGFAPGSVWSTARGDNQRSGIVNTRLKSFKENPFRIQWVADLGDAIYSSPVFDSRGNAYLGCDAKKIVKISTFDGTTVWEQQTLGRIKSSGAIYKDRIFFGDDKGVLYCIDRETGQEIWKHQTGGPILGSLAAFQNDSDHYGCVAFVSFDKKLYLMNALAKSPVIRWTLDVDGWSVNAPSVDYNPNVRISDSEPVSKVIYITTSNNRVLCVSAATGKIISEYSTRSAIETPPVVHGTTVIVSSADGIVSGLDFSSWLTVPFVAMKEETNHPLASASIFDPITDSLIFECKPGEIVCMSERTPWRYVLGDSMKTSPALVLSPNGQSTALVACSDTGKIAIIDIQTGKELTKINLGNSITSSPAVYDTGYPAILVGTIDRKLYCISQRPELTD